MAGKDKDNIKTEATDKSATKKDKKDKETVTNDGKTIEAEMTVSDKTTIQTTTDNANTVQNTAFVIPTPLAEKIAAGEVSNTFYDNPSWDEKYTPLAKWFGENVLENMGTVTQIQYTNSKFFPYFEEFELSLVYFNLSFQKDGMAEKKEIALLVGEIQNSNQFILIDGEVTTSQNYSLEAHWAKVKNHAVFGKYVGEFPKTIISKGLTEISLSSFLKQDYEIIDIFQVSGNTAGIISAKKKPDNNGYEQFRVDLFDLEKNQRIGKGHLFTEIEDGWKMYGATVFRKDENNFFMESFLPSMVEDVRKYAWYKIHISPDGTISDTLTFYDTAPSDEYVEPLQSDSGRYSAITKNRDVYLHESVTNADTLVYDSKPDEITEETDVAKNYQTGVAAYFIGERLYYAVYGYEWPEGVGYFDPETGEAVFLKNKIGAYFSAGGYNYGYSDVHSDDFYFGRAPLGNLLNVERLVLGYTADRSSFICSADGKYVVQVSEPESNDNSLKWQKETSTVTVYDAATFTPVKTETMQSAVCSLDQSYVRRIGKYVLITAEGETDKAYSVMLP